jgi:hypothetical protein
VPREALYVQGVSTRKVTISAINKSPLERFASRQLEEAYPYAL